MLVFVRRSRRCARVWRCSGRRWTRVGGRQRWGIAARHEAGRGRAWAGSGQARQHQAAQEVQGVGVHIDEGRGWSPHAVFPRVSSAVLFSDDRRDGSVHVARGDGDGDAGDNTNLAIELITPIAMEKELRFAIREGGRTVGAGVVSDIME